MSGSSQQTDTGYGRLMDCLLKERSHYATEEEFRAFTVESVRRLITDLRQFNIELSIRPNTAPLLYPSTEKLGD